MPLLTELFYVCAMNYKDAAPTALRIPEKTTLDRNPPVRFDEPMQAKELLSRVRAS
jgi:hypothetical protein